MRVLTGSLHRVSSATDKVTWEVVGRCLSDARGNLPPAQVTMI